MLFKIGVITNGIPNEIFERGKTPTHFIVKFFSFAPIFI